MPARLLRRQQQQPPAQRRQQHEVLGMADPSQRMLVHRQQRKRRRRRHTASRRSLPPQPPRQQEHQQRVGGVHHRHTGANRAGCLAQRGQDDRVHPVHAGKLQVVRMAVRRLVPQQQLGVVGVFAFVALQRRGGQAQAHRRRQRDYQQQPRPGPPAGQSPPARRWRRKRFNAQITLGGDSFRSVPHSHHLEQAPFEARF
jgi:hypothetical protein